MTVATHFHMNGEETLGHAGLERVERVVETPAGPARIQGYVDPRFAGVVDAYAQGFANDEEIGSSTAGYRHGRKIYDLWGGHADKARTIEWSEHTIVNTMSTTKAFSATCLMMLVDRGLVDLDAPIARYWPEFAQAGKAKIPVRYILDHRAGLARIDRPAHRGGIFDTQAMEEGLAAQAPNWEPGSQAGYHVLTMGFLIGAIVRRVSGKTLGTFLRDEIALPLKLDFHVGLPVADHARAAEFVNAERGTIFQKAAAEPDSLIAKATAQLPESSNSPAFRSCEHGSGNGHGTARAVARFYACLVAGRRLDGVTLMRPDTIATMTTQQHRLTEIVNNRDYCQALGMLRNSPEWAWMGPNENAFGHHGVGGSIGLADPDTGLSFSYLMNKMHERIDNGPRARRLIEASFASL
ncbi:serine hydrolase [Bosea sp. (in: a-proteobacteria)]|uniref:serine hydrolase domain-containing protein n=1 Tax=Bosea sp. (in: a-proteobacteria) TaxID=1871050 RepID=UPI002613D422|nr:serine hydrolase domain-containing protein [Bosea sp. (in: a-proteobacteria)]MCO5092929.1 beta-lactamase family protein [Bosea sp. (in: a-proteobacteria)]